MSQDTIRIGTGDFRRTEALFGWMMGGPAFLGMFLFVILPFLMAIGLSFTNQRLVSPNPAEFIGLRNYDRLLSVAILTLEPLADEATGEVLRDEEGNIEFPRSRSILRTEAAYEGFFEWFTLDAFGKRYVIAAKDPSFMRSLMNNFFFSGIVVPLQSGLALGLALLVNQKIRGSNVFRTIYFSPVVTSTAVLSVVWIFLYNPQPILINRFIQFISFGHVGPFNWLGSTESAMVAIIIMSIWQGVGFQMVIFLAGLQGIAEVLYEAASIDGANARQRFWHVTLPGLRNTIVFVAITTTIFAFRLFTQVDVMTQGGPRDDATSTVVFHAVQEGFRGLNLGYGATISVVFFLIVLTVALIQRRVLRSTSEVE
jgi:multiple sugar transport system permease protein